MEINKVNGALFVLPITDDYLFFCGRFRQNLPSLHHKPRPSDKEHRLETWEDLLAVPTSNTTGNQQTHRFSVQGEPNTNSCL